MKRLSRPAVLLAIAATAMVLVLLPRLWIELQWFQQFELGPVVLKRWGLQFLALVLVLGIGIPVQLNQLQRCWKLRRRDPAYRGESIFMPLKGWGLLLVLLLVLGLLSTATSYLFVQALGLLQEPFSGSVEQLPRAGVIAAAAGDRHRRSVAGVFAALATHHLEAEPQPGDPGLSNSPGSSLELLVASDFGVAVW